LLYAEITIGGDVEEGYTEPPWKGLGNVHPYITAWVAKSHPGRMSLHRERQVLAFGVHRARVARHLDEIDDFLIMTGNRGRITPPHPSR